jgi:hypothetical protein
MVGTAQRIGRWSGWAAGLGIGAALTATPGLAAADATDPVVPVDGGASAVLNGDTIALDPYPPGQIVTTIHDPFDTQVISDQGFVLQPPGATQLYDGEYFQGTVNDTTFSYGPTDQYIDVTFSDQYLPPGPGSIINVLNYGGGFENAYASIEGSAPADEIITPLGNFAVPTGIVEFLGPDFFIPSVDTTTATTASAVDPTAAASAAATGLGLSAATAGNQYDPAVIPYSPDPSNLFAPVYTITPAGPEQAISTVTDPNNIDTTDTFGTQDFSVSSLGFPVDTFTGNVEYTPTPFDSAAGSAGILSQLSQELGFGPGYSEEIFTNGGTGTVVPNEFTGFLVQQFGFGYGNVFEESMNTAGTSSTVGDFILTPFGNENITPIIDALMNITGTLPEATSAVDPSSFIDLLSSIGL